MFDWIDELIEATGCDWETAAREYDYYHNIMIRKIMSKTRKP